MRFRKLTQDEIDDIILTEEDDEEEVPEFETFEDWQAANPDEEIPGNTDDDTEDIEDVDIGS